MIEITRFFFSHLRVRMIFIVILSICAFFIETIGILVFIPLFESLFSASDGDSPQRIDFFITLPTNIETFLFSLSPLTIGLGFIIMFTLKGFFLFYTKWFIHIGRIKLQRSLRQECLKNIRNLSYTQYLNNESSTLLNVTIEHTNKTTQVFLNFITATVEMLGATIFAVLGFIVFPELAMLFFVTISLAAAVHHLIQINIINLSVVTARYTNSLSSMTLQLIRGYTYLTATQLKDSYTKKIDNIVVNAAQVQTKIGMLLSISVAMREPLLAIFLVVALLVGSVTSDKGFADIITALFFFYRAMNSLMTCLQNWQSLGEGMGSVKYVTRALEQDVKSCGISNKHTITQTCPVSNCASGAVKFENVSFVYENSDRAALQNVSFEVTSGEFVSLVGASGSGKTTIALMALGILVPQTGRINSGKVALGEIGYVSQDTFIFNGTILYNITLTNNPNNISVRKANTLLEKLGLTDMVSALPEGVDTEIGENGLKLSGGQKQRLFICRELFRDPKLLVLDEATSALDEKSESLVMAALKACSPGITIIQLSHRLTTVLQSSKVVCLDEGRIVEIGEPALLAKNEQSFFARLFTTSNANY